MSTTWTPCGKCHPLSLEHRKLQGTKCQLEIHQSNTPQMEREGCRVLCVFTAKLTEFSFSLSRHNWETGNGKLDRGRFRCEAEKARPEKPERSTEGQAGLRARRRVWPSVSIGLVPIIRVVLVGQSREALVTAQRPARGDRLITSSAYCWTMGPGRRSVQPDHRRTPKAAVPWGGSFCFPLMAPLSSQLRPASPQPTDSHFPFPVSRFPRQGETNPIFTHFKCFSFDAPKTFHCVLQNISSWEIQEPISHFPFPECWQLHSIQFPTRQFPISHFPLGLFYASTSNFPFPISHLVPGSSRLGAISRFPFPPSHPSSRVEAHSQFPISHFPQPWNLRFRKREE